MITFPQNLNIAGLRSRHAIIALIVIVALLAGYGLALVARSPTAAPSSPTFSAQRYSYAPAAGPMAYKSAADGTAHTRPTGSNAGNLPSDIIRTAGLTIKVGHKQAQKQTGKAAVIAAGLGGYVVDTSSGGKNSPVTITMRVPSQNFYKALGQLRKLGSVESNSISGQDVTLQVVDLHARLVSLQAQRARLLQLFAKAKTVGQTITVQNVLSNVQYQIQETQGQINYLANRVSYSTITVMFLPKGSKHAAASSTIGNAFGKAGKAIIDVIAGAIIVVGVALPFLGFALIAYGVFLLGRRLVGRRKPAMAAPHTAN